MEHRLRSPQGVANTAVVVVGQVGDQVDARGGGGGGATVDRHHLVAAGGQEPD
jgi:hypothetical protein